jgi:hypothetical protein
MKDKENPYSDPPEDDDSLDRGVAVQDSMCARCTLN